MALTIELPHVGESVVEGTIGKWLKQPGDKVERYEPLVEVVTDKVTMEVPSPASGSLLKILAQEGETVPMGAPIAELDAPDAPAQAQQQPAAAEAPTAPDREAVSRATTGYLVKDERPVGPTGGGVEEETEETAAPAAAEAPETEAGDGRRRLSPAVRRLAREHNIDVSQVPGTGLGGRITRDDVLSFIESGGAAAAAPEAPPTPRPAPTETGAAEAGPDEEYVTLSPVRRMVAEAMTRSASQIPHAWSAVEVDVTGLVALRQQRRAEFHEREGVDLTYLSFVIKAVVEALKENPTLNASWGGDKIVLKKRINIGLAVAAPAGLVVPVVHDADRLSISGLAHAVADLTQRARQNKLVLEDVQGGTFTLNNTGALGSVVSQPIINYPQAAIMTTEAVVKRPVVINDAIAIRSMMNLCLSFDHRVNDGAEASEFLQSVKRRLESLSPETSIY